MKVHFDDQVFTWQPRGGISRYFVELMCAFRDEALGVELTRRSMWTQNWHLAEAGMGHVLPPPMRRRRRLLRALNGVSAPRGGVDVIHHTYYDADYLRRPPTGSIRAVTVYDMIPELFPDVFPGGNPHKDKREFVDAADLIFCISESTRRDLIAVYGRPRAPIIVTPLGVDDRFHPGGPRPPGLPASYVLFVGQRDQYKDFTVLVRAFGAASLPTDVQLVAVGGGAWTESEHHDIARAGISGRVAQIDLSDDQLPGAYAHALCFVFPSRYEGFGLPTLEAMASGCPTILADSSSHPEVGGEVACYFAPTDDGHLAESLSLIVADPGRRAAMSAAGLARAREFTWSRTAAQTAQAYHAAS